IADAEDVLDSCSEELRHWEWHYLKRLCHQQVITLGGHTDEVLSVCYSPDGALVATASRDGAIKLWRSKDGKEQLTLRGHKGWVNSVGFCLGGQKLVTAGQDNSVRVWDITSGEEIRCFEGAGHLLTVSSEGDFIASVSLNRTVRVRKLAT